MSKLTPKQARFVEEYLVDVDRFWSYVDRLRPDACWPWMRATDSGGYGRFHVGRSRNSSMLAHRVAYALTNGHLPEAVCHTCDNPPCCNPAHLVGADRAFNNRDMMRKGRHWSDSDPSRAARGTATGKAKLSEAQVIDIRDRYGSGGVTQYELARDYGVSQRTINKVVRRIGWTHV